MRGANRSVRLRALRGKLGRAAGTFQVPVSPRMILPTPRLRRDELLQLAEEEVGFDVFEVGSLRDPFNIISCAIDSLQVCSVKVRTLEICIEEARFGKDLNLFSKDAGRKI